MLSPTMTMMNTVTSSSVAVSFGSRLLKRITPSFAVPRADHDHRAEHEQRVGEQRADDRRLRHHGLARLQREDHDEQLGQVAERRLQQPGHRRAELLADLLGGERHDVGEPGERDRRQAERQQRGAAAVARDARPRP